MWVSEAGVNHKNIEDHEKVPDLPEKLETMLVTKLGADRSLALCKLGSLPELTAEFQNEQPKELPRAES
jgi:hypothetical protein